MSLVNYFIVCVKLCVDIFFFFNRKFNFIDFYCLMKNKFKVLDVSFENLKCIFFNFIKYYFIGKICYGIFSLVDNSKIIYSFCIDILK